MKQETKKLNVGQHYYKKKKYILGREELDFYYSNVAAI